jgi:hypothetical protein
LGENLDSKPRNNILLSWSRLSRCPTLHAAANRRRRRRKNLLPFYKKEKKKCLLYVLPIFLFPSAQLCGCRGVSDPSSIFRLDGDNDQVSDLPLSLFPRSSRHKKKLERIAASVCLQQNSRVRDKQTLREKGTQLYTKDAVSSLSNQNEEGKTTISL